MKPSSRRLNSVLRLLEMREMDARNELAKTFSELRLEEIGMRSIDTKLDVLRNDITRATKTNGSLNVDRIRRVQHLECWYIEEQYRQTLQIERATTAIEEARDQLSVAHKNRSSLSRLCERKRQFAQSEQTVRDQRSLDEQGVVKFSAKKHH